MRTLTIFTALAFVLASISLNAQQGGYALEFGGTKYVNCGNDASVSISGTAISLEAWVYPTAFSTNQWENVIVNKLGNSTHGYNLRCGGNGIVEFYVSYNFTNTGYAISSAGAIELNKWTHLAGTYDGANVKLYINGKLTVTTAYTESIPAQDMPLIIGNHGDTRYLTRPFIGRIDEVRIWNVTRTEEQIKANMYKEIAPHDNLKAYYKMSNGSGTSLTDNSGNNTGTLTNGPSWKISGCFAGSRQSLDFDGSDDFVNLPVSFSNAFDGLQHFSFCGWVYQTAINTANWGTYYSVQNTTSHGGRVTFHQNPSTHPAGADDVLISISQNTSSLYGEAYTTGNVIELNKWIHFSVVFDGTVAGNSNRLKLFLNGVETPLTFSYDIPSAFASDFNSREIARHGNSNYFKGGKFDEFSFWNLSLTESQIQDIMFKSLVGNESGLFAYYRFDQTDGSTLYDMTSNGHHGTLTNMDASTDWVSSTAFNTWLGGESNAWATVGNWSSGVPTSAQSAGIYNWSSALPNVPTYLPVLPATISVNNFLVTSDVSSSGNVNLNATGSVFLGSSITLASNALNTADNLVVESSKTLTLPTGGQLTVARQLDNQGNFTMQSGGSLITNGTLTNSGTMQISRTLTESVWHMISIPVEGITANTFLGDYLQSWNETTGEWINISDPLTPLNTKQGYSLWATPAKSDATYTFTGTLLTGDQSTPITYHAVSGKDFDGANLLGNPYPSSIDWDLLQATYGSNYIWDGTAYKAYSSQSGYELGYRYIPPMQGFFILTTNPTGNFNLTNTARTHTGASNFYKSSGSKSFSNGIVLEATNGSYSDEWCLVFNPEASEGFELPRDARKLQTETSGISQLWSVCPDGNLAIDIRPETGIVQLGFSNDQAGIYSIGLSEMADIASAVLEDTKTGIFHNLHPDSYPGGAYEFTWNPETDIETRFKLHLNSVGIEETPISESDILIFATNNQIFIKGAENGEMMVSDIMGRVVLRQEIAESGLISFPLNIQSGVYVVIVTTDNEMKSEKVFIK